MGTNMRILMAAGVAGLLALTACDNVPQPKPGCTIGQGDFAAKYTPKAGETPTGPCAALKGDIINLRDYTDDKSGKDFISIRARQMGTLSAGKTDPNPANRLYAFGEYPDHSNEQNFCVSPTFEKARLQLPDGNPPVDLTYEWSNVQILVTSRAAGTQLKADLKYTDAVANCSVNFNVVAMWPAIPCGTKDANGNTVPDNTKCATKADPAKGIKVGCNAQGCLSPDIKTYCDSDLLLCVLDGTPPVFADDSK